ncbi:hypothetical protein RIF29_31493 [Crotalaria pallida]|uniref:Uncharacterized protein n=1 Tax=Crotalaria pallida TaxID=3830 RepID=A0AAN9EJG8_CROPI
MGSLHQPLTVVYLKEREKKKFADEGLLGNIRIPFPNESPKGGGKGRDPQEERRLRTEKKIESTSLSLSLSLVLLCIHPSLTHSIQ